jgi:hypothetical protein
MSVVNSLKVKINKLQAEIYAIEHKQEVANIKTLVEEVLNFQQGVGSGYTEGDYYANSRYYSSIPGVKNFSTGVSGDVNYIYVKLVSPIGKLLPKNIEINGIEYTISFFYSKNYSEIIDY